MLNFMSLNVNLTTYSPQVPSSKMKPECRDARLLWTLIVQA